MSLRPQFIELHIHKPFFSLQFNPSLVYSQVTQEALRGRSGPVCDKSLMAEVGMEIETPQYHYHYTDLLLPCSGGHQPQQLGPLHWRRGAHWQTLTLQKQIEKSGTKSMPMSCHCQSWGIFDHIASITSCEGVILLILPWQAGFCVPRLMWWRIWALTFLDILMLAAASHLYLPQRNFPYFFFALYYLFILFVAAFYEVLSCNSLW